MWSSVQHLAGAGFGSPNITISPHATNLGHYVRDLYMLRFQQDVDAGRAKPFVTPYALLGCFILPILYFSIPHVNRPWLYTARYFVMAIIVAFSLSEVVSTASTNVAVAYGVGLCQSWSVLWNFTLLICMRPQFDAERVEKRRKVGGAVANGNAKHAGNGHAASNGNGNEIAIANGNGSGKTSSGKEGQLAVKMKDAPDEDIARSLEAGFEYYWQAYPADAPFLTRLGWSADLCCAFRGSGWNWAVPSIPRFAKPEKPLSGELVELNSIPVATRMGYRRHTTSGPFLREKLLQVFIGYIILDSWSVFCLKDPYFVLGPEHGQPLPAILAAMPPWLLSLYRSSAACTGVFVALRAGFMVWQLSCHYTLRPILGTRGELWHQPSANGSFDMVLTKGLAGFWGGWWHQTFRVAFSAPTNWLVQHHYLDYKSIRGRIAASFIAFAQSAFLHAFGSMTCLPPTKPWQPPLFFLLSWVGVILQQALCQVLRKPVLEKCPSWVRRGGNLVYVLVWLHLTQWLFIDDVSRSALWLFEPVPVSPWRAMGFGKPGDSWMRWTRENGISVYWYTGRHWWESGIAI